MNVFLDISGLTKRYGATSALESVTLSLGRGDALALLGPNGAGKSTLFGCILGLAIPTSGSIYFEGQPINEGCRANFGYAPERVSLYLQRTVIENAAFFARLQGRAVAEAERQLERVGLGPFLERRVRQLSKGMLQRLGLALALCGQPRLLILDEPFNGLDPAWLDRLQGILVEEKSRGATLLISTHTIRAIEPIATHLAVLLEGRLASFSQIRELRAEHADGFSLEEIYHSIARQEHPLEVVCA